MCTISKGRSLNPDYWRSDGKREALIEQIQQDLARWDKIVTFNVHMTAIEDSAKIKMSRERVKRINEEMKLAAKAVLLMRQAALRDLFQSENKQYLHELHLKGKTIYKERL